MPLRIQRKRTKGWKLPEGAVYVGRPTKWGNPWTIVANGRWRAIENFRQMIARTPIRRAGWVGAGFVSYPSNGEIQAELRGKDLACWCSPIDPCHADVLLEVANA